MHCKLQDYIATALPHLGVHTFDMTYACPRLLLCLVSGAPVSDSIIAAATLVESRSPHVLRCFINSC